MKHELVAKLFRGFGDVSRLRVLEALRDGPLHVGAIVARTGLSQPSVSMHLACLVDCGLAARERQGRFVEYRVADPRAGQLLEQGAELARELAPLVEACPRYHAPAAARTARPPASRRARRRR